METRGDRVSGSAAAQSTQARRFQLVCVWGAAKEKPRGNQSTGKTPLLKVTGFAAREGVSEEHGAEVMMGAGGGKLKSRTKKPVFSRQKPSRAPRERERDSSTKLVAGHWGREVW